MNEQTTRDTLRRVGFEHLQLDARLPNASNNELARVDLVAWASNADGELVPWAVVETKTTRVAPLPSQSALAILARSRDLLGTVDHYIVLNEQWFRADAGLRTLTPVDGPEPPPYGGQGEIRDVDFATSLVTNSLWRAADRLRAEGRSRMDYIFSAAPIDLTLDSASGPDAPTRAFGGLLMSRELLWEAVRRAAVEFARRGGGEAGMFTSHAVITEAVASIAAAKLRQDVLDPFCGSGSFLWEAIDVARKRGVQLKSVLGFDINQRMVQFARSIAEASPVPVSIEHSDAFEADLPLSTCVMSAPPAGLRASQPYKLLDGTVTRDGDFVAVDRAVRVLADGGRAVLHLSAGFASRQPGRFREFLAEHYRIAALIGLPPGAMFGTAIRSVLLVIDNAAPGDTFVAQLGEDWEAQLARGGAALEAAIHHIDEVQA